MARRCFRDEVRFRHESIDSLMNQQVNRTIIGAVFETRSDFATRINRLTKESTSQSNDSSTNHHSKRSTKNSMYPVNDALVCFADVCQEEYEVVCDGDVCEKRPVGSKTAKLPQVAQVTSALDAAGSPNPILPNEEIAPPTVAPPTTESDPGATTAAADDVGDSDNDHNTSVLDEFPLESTGGVKGDGDDDDDNPGVAQLVNMSV